MAGPLPAGGSVGPDGGHTHSVCTDAHAAEPTHRPVSIEDLGATIYHALGINTQKEYHTNGRPVRINKDGKPVQELFG